MDLLISKVADNYYESGYASIPEFISEETVDILLNEVEQQKSVLHKAGIGSKNNYQLQEEIRGDYIKWIDPIEDDIFNRLYLRKLELVIESFNRLFYLGINNAEHHVAYYPPGTYYRKHVDVFKDKGSRVVSSVLYLNKNWQPQDGGELIIYPEGKPEVKIEPRAGLLVLFESRFPHEVCLCHAPRYSVTGWFKRGGLL